MGDFFTSFSWIEIFKATMVLFAVVDIVGSIPIIIKLKEQSGEEIGALRASAVSLGIMIGFLILGESILNLFGVDVKSFAVASSLILYMYMIICIQTPVLCMYVIYIYIYVCMYVCMYTNTCIYVYTDRRSVV